MATPVIDAKFVDVIHTSGKTGNVLPFGTTKPIGHTDFYPNGGDGKQGGCKYKNLSCSHHRVIGTGYKF